MRTFILLIAFAAIFSCGNNDIGRPVKFVNNSPSTIFIAYSILYPDTALKESYTICDLIRPNSFSLCYSTEGDWDTEFNRNKNGILQFFIFDIDTVNKYGYSICREEYKILRRYQYSKDDLENLDRTITYP